MRKIREIKIQLPLGWLTFIWATRCWASENSHEQAEHLKYNFIFMISQKHFDEIFLSKNLATEITFFSTFYGSAKN